MWGIFGPVSVKTKRGSRVTFFAAWLTLPLTAVSLWTLLHGEPRKPAQQQQQRSLPELDLSRVD